MNLIQTKILPPQSSRRLLGRHELEFFDILCYLEENLVAPDNLALDWLYSREIDESSGEQTPGSNVEQWIALYF